MRYFVFLICLFFTVLIMVGCNGCGGLATGYRAVLIIRNAGDQTSKAMGEISLQAHKKCQDKSVKPDGKTDKEKYKVCIKPYRDMLEKWTKYVKPAINSALKLTYASLETAYKAKKKEAPWAEKIKPALCGLIGALLQWKHLLEKKADKILKPLQAIQGLACK